MEVDSVIWTSQPLDWDRVSEVLEERLCDRYPVFRSVAVRDADGSWWWQEDEAFSFDERVTTVKLDDPDDPRSLQRLAARHRTEMLDRDKPLWRALYVDRYREGSAIVLRTHHALADGMRMVQLSMSLFDAAAEGGAVLGPAVTQHAAHPAPPGLPATERVRAGLTGVVTRRPDPSGSPSTRATTSRSRSPGRRRSWPARCGWRVRR
jgi:diacylglycerol O-acyltransferase